jgi:hypothetical protein
MLWLMYLRIVTMQIKEHLPHHSLPRSSACKLLNWFVSVAKNCPNFRNGIGRNVCHREKVRAIFLLLKDARCRERMSCRPSLRGAHERIQATLQPLSCMATISANHLLATVEVSGIDGRQHRNVTGILQGSVGKSLILTAGQDIPASALVTVRTQDRLYLGEVLKSIPEKGAKWTIHVLTRRALMIV